MNPNRHESRRSVEDRNALVLQWQFLPMRVAGDFKRAGKLFNLPYWDAVGIGQLALIRAGDIWDETRGVKFNTYATASIKRLILERTREDGVVRVPDNVWRGPYREQARRALACASLPDCRRLDGSQAHPVYERVAGVTREIWPVDTYDEERIREMLGVMSVLTWRQRLVIRLRFWEGMLLHEIAEVVGVTKQAVQSMEKDAIARLRRAMEVAA